MSAWPLWGIEETAVLAHSREVVPAMTEIEVGWLTAAGTPPGTAALTIGWVLFGTGFCLGLGLGARGVSQGALPRAGGVLMTLLDSELELFAAAGLRAELTDEALRMG